MELFQGARSKLETRQIQQSLRQLQFRILPLSEAIGAAGYILIGAACVVLGGLFLQNLFPLGQSGSVAAGGTVAFIDIGVGLEVSGGVSLALLVYLEELLEDKEA